ncbi:hypothetical protein [Streptomyces pini]|uniref:Uncharacterized protein n=1 Tax=Streptomyces pini TaxID=1520580 RepID=A0A1I4C2U6_9ACTN|nr:hypothetical protein [Streptomyces pini]SFK74659.1 hypothetical protein SAMN05192584_108212 [Streptomyces pini]
MPKLDKDADVEVKLDPEAAMLHQAIPDELRRGLFEAPGSRVVAVVELASTSYTGHAAGEDKAPQVKLRVTLAEVATDAEQIQQLREVQRAMMRRRRMQDTLDELGPGSHDAERAVAELLAHHPTEGEFEAHQEQQQRRSRRGGVRVEQRG